MQQEDKVQVITRTDRPACSVANGILVCNCGECEPEDYKLPRDYGKKK